MAAKLIASKSKVWQFIGGDLRGWITMNWTANPTFQKDVFSSGETDPLLKFEMRYAFYAAGTAIFLMITALIVKLLWDCEGDEPNGEAARATESTRLLPAKENAAIAYGTSSEDPETGSTSSSDDLYDGKICLICYDDQRNCFFVPCGHCVACRTCAHRIMNEESKSCPICRGIIDKVRKLHIA